LFNATNKTQLFPWSSGSQENIICSIAVVEVISSLTHKRGKRVNSAFY